MVSGGLVGGLIGARVAQSESVRFNTRLPIPALIDAAKQGGAVKLKVTSGRHAFLKGKPTRSYGYSGPVLGPVVRMRRGDEVEITVENTLDSDTTIHWHGLLVPGYVDGGPHQIIKSGGTWRPRLKIEQPASTAWFHPHLHHDSARQVYMGLTGLIIVDDGSDAGLGLPRTYGIDDLPIIIQDRSFDTDGSLLYDPDPDPQTIQYGSRGDTIIVNGVVRPVAQVPCSLVRLRIVNAANAQNFDLRFSDRREFRVIASDAGFLAAPVSVNQLRISPAERFEILVDFGNREPVMLETGPDTVMGIFGAVSPDDATEFVSIMRFEPTATAGLVKHFPGRLVEPAEPMPIEQSTAANSCWTAGYAEANGRRRRACFRACASTERPMTWPVSTSRPGLAHWKSGKSFRSAWLILFTCTARHSAFYHSMARHRRLIWRAGRTWFSSRTRPNFWLPSITPRPRSIPSCITVTSLNMRMPA
jgi:FtsP/CotA-like multicopper oxidase with cupredoxin domain